MNKRNKLLYTKVLYQVFIVHTAFLTLFPAFSSLWVEFSHTLQWQDNVQQGEASVEIHCLEPPSRPERKWTHRSLFFTPLPLPRSTASLPFLFLSLTRGIKLIIQKVTCGLSPLPLLLFPSYNEKKRQNKPGGSFNPHHPGQVTLRQTSVSSSYCISLSHRFLVHWQYFLHSRRWKGDYDYSRLKRGLSKRAGTCIKKGIIFERHAWEDVVAIRNIS